MARINTNIASLISQRALANTNSDLQVRLQRLSTGLRINRGADDPAGLIVSERLRSEIRGLTAAVGNSERASSVIATTEGYLTEVSDLLNSIRALVVEASNTGALSQEEIEANQLQVDSAIESITRISNTASFAGLQLLNGSLDYLTSGVASSAISGVSIYNAQFGTNPDINVSVEVVSSATTAALFLSGAYTGGAAAANGTMLSTVTLEIAGNEGVQTVQFVSGTALSAVVTAINLFKDATGVSAALASATNQSSGIQFFSTDYGSKEFVSVQKIGAGGDFFTVQDIQGGTTVLRDEGNDVTALVNGALALGNGLEVTIDSPTISMDLLLTELFAQTTNQAKAFRITGGGANFQLGPSITLTQQVGFGMQSVAASRLGQTVLNGAVSYLESIATGQANSLLSGRAQQASEILDSAITEVSVLRGRLGAFERNTLQTNIRSLAVGIENITASESKVRDADFAAETAALTRAQILSQAGTSILATANANAQNVLQLLG